MTTFEVRPSSNLSFDPVGRPQSVPVAPSNDEEEEERRPISRQSQNEPSPSTRSARAWNEEIERVNSYQDALGGFDGSILARVGFYYDQNFESVQCFSCGARHRFTSTNDVSLYRHLRNCDFANGRPSGNVPLEASNTTRRITKSQEARQRLNRIRSRGGDPHYSSAFTPVGVRRVAEGGNSPRTLSNGHTSSRATPPGERPSGQSTNLNRNNELRSTPIVTNINNNDFDISRSSTPPEGVRELDENARTEQFGTLLRDRERRAEELVDETRGRQRFRSVPNFTRAYTRAIYLDESPPRSPPAQQRTGATRRTSNNQSETPFRFIDPASPYLTPTERQSIRQFPCNRAAHPDMRSVNARVQTFSRWPPFHTNCSPRQIAEAGLYYIGTGDQTVCWYCGGGLENWRREDNPWEEHAKWHPVCEHLLQQRGMDYVQRVSREHSNMPRRDIGHVSGHAPSTPTRTRNVTNITILPPEGSRRSYNNEGTRRNIFIPGNSSRPRRGSRNRPPSPPQHSYRPSSPPSGMGIYPPNLRWRRAEVVSPGGTRTVDYRAEGIRVHEVFPGGGRSSNSQQGRARQGHTATLDEAMRSSCVQQAIEIGFSRENIRRVVGRRLNLLGRNFETTYDLVEELVSLDETIPSEVATPRELPQVESGPDHLFPANSNTEQRNQQICQSCGIRPAQRVFLPCGHLVTCSRCGNSMERCVTCNRVIESHVDVNRE